MACISVVTPTYNRAHTLGRVFDSLLLQAHTELEWVVVDDGSTDGTEALIGELQARAPFPVRYHRQVNGGRHTALNRGFAMAAGEFVVIMDSDDWLSADALERFMAEWLAIDEAVRPTFAGVAGLCDYPTGELIGTRFPADPLDSDFLAMRAFHGVKGDKKEMIRADVLRRFPFPVFAGEKRVPTSLILNRISREYRVRFFNHVVTTKEYQADGLSATLDRVRAKSPTGSRLRYREYLLEDGRAPLRLRLRGAANYFRYALHGGIGLAAQLRELRWRVWWLAALPVGAALYLRDSRGTPGSR